jgi:5-oxoprolinase (ATP-hydrolysing) subunit A
MNIELSCDLGEASDEHDRQIERAIWPMIDAANVACGGHAGDAASMREAALAAAEHGVIFGAHPSYPDRAGFGRKTMDMAPSALLATLIAQIAALAEIASRQDVALQRVKPHGALYNDAHQRIELARVIVAAMKHVDASLSIVAAETSAMALAAREAGVDVIREAFADRRYRDDGGLVSRSESDALLSVEEAARQAALLAAERVVITRSGQRLPIEFDTICIHADMAGSVERLRAIRAVATP